MQNISLINILILVFSITVLILLFSTITSFEIVFAILWYTIVVGFGVSVILHRELTHNSINSNTNFRNIVLTIFTATTGISPCSWVVVHKVHHKYSDKEFDPHPPTFKGLINNIIGSIQVPKKEGIVFSKRLLTDGYIAFLHKHNQTIFFGFLLVLTMISYQLLAIWALVFLGYKIQGVLNAFLAHRFGYRNYQLNNDSTNDIITTIISFGEGLHNNHHAYPTKSNFAHKKWEIDLGYILISVLKQLRLAKESS